ncbi:hypothetical protein F5B18DRAFT_573137 [Nemania serpens]|nr:hypothetical protein F5B18DRAFT_573137 [Nemania serpens]
MHMRGRVGLGNLTIARRRALVRCRDKIFSEDKKYRGDHVRATGQSDLRERTKYVPYWARRIYKSTELPRNLSTWFLVVFICTSTHSKTHLLKLIPQLYSPPVYSTPFYPQEQQQECLEPQTIRPLRGTQVPWAPMGARRMNRSARAESVRTLRIRRIRLLRLV